MVEIKVTGGELPQDEVDAYVAYIQHKYPDKRLSSLEIAVDGDDVGLTYHWEPVPFTRIRRVTGYLVGTLDRFNDAKRSEEADRIKHL